jgi:hypothetical protein
MSNFWEGYEDVAKRVKRWQVAFPVGRIETEVVWHDPIKGQVLVKAAIYREHEDTLAAAIDWAYGDVTNYPQSMRKWYVEDTVTSAIGRAISLVLETDKKPTSQDMAKVDYVNNKSFADKLADKITVPVADDPWTVHAVEPAKPASMTVDEVAAAIGAKVLTDDPKCDHGNRIWKTGTSKTGKPWGMWACDARPMNGQRFADVDKCDPIWYDIQKDGTWGPRVDK